MPTRATEALAVTGQAPIGVAQGRGNVIAHEPDPTETAVLGYARGDLERAIEEVVTRTRAARA